MIYSSSSILAWESRGDCFYFFKKQLLWSLFGGIALILGWGVNYKAWQKVSRLLVLGGIALLVMTLTPKFGREAYGARRWLSVFGFSFQPVEFVKIALVVYTADLLSRKKEIRTQTLLPLLILLGVISLLLLLQPNLGSVLIISLIVIILLIVGGMKMRYLVGLLLASLPFLYFLIWRVEYRRARILAFLNPWEDPYNKGYQVIHSLIALGSGGLFGRGLGESREKLFYLPQSHTDFIFSIIGEEIGFLGSILIIGLFMMLFFCGVKIALSVNDPFGTLLAFGITSMITLQALINISIATGMLPVAGLPLPFLSFGGSSLLCNMASVGVLLNISTITNRKKKIEYVRQ
jgi:cell division protein FtsW